MIKSQFKRGCCRRAGALALVAVLFGCTSSGQPLEPKILSLNYMVIQYSDPAAISALIASIQSGQTTVADELPTDPCNFTADDGDTAVLSIDINGIPGDSGFNIAIWTSGLVNITTTNPTDCQPVSSINMTIGSASEALDVGGQTNNTSAIIVMGGNTFNTGDELVSNQFFEASLMGFRPQTGYARGEFQFVSAAPGTAANARLLVSGFYADD